MRHMGKYSNCKKFENTFPQLYSSVHWGDISIWILWKKIWKMSIHLPLTPTFVLFVISTNLKNSRKICYKIRKAYRVYQSQAKGLTWNGASITTITLDYTMILKILVGTRDLRTLWSPLVSLNQERHTQRRKATNYLFIYLLFVTKIRWKVPHETERTDSLLNTLCTLVP
jgi:hypothetical protein